MMFAGKFPALDYCKREETKCPPRRFIVSVARPALLIHAMYACGMSEQRSVYLQFDLPLLNRLDDFKYKHSFPSRSEAARWLLQLALDQEPAPPWKL